MMDSNNSPDCYVNSETPRQVVEKLIAAWNTRDVEQVLAIYTPDYIEEDIAQSAPQRGLEAVRRSVRRYIVAFPDMQLTLDDIMVEGDRAAFVWTLRGTHRGGGLLNIPSTGRYVEMRGTSFITVQNGKISRNVRIWDMAGLLRTIGLLPDL